MSKQTLASTTAHARQSLVRNYFETLVESGGLDLATLTADTAEAAMLAAESRVTSPGPVLAPFWAERDELRADALAGVLKELS